MLINVCIRVFFRWVGDGASKRCKGRAWHWWFTWIAWYWWLTWPCGATRYVGQHLSVSTTASSFHNRSVGFSQPAVIKCHISDKNVLCIFRKRNSCCYRLYASIYFGLLDFFRSWVILQISLDTFTFLLLCPIAHILHLFWTVSFHVTFGLPFLFSDATNCDEVAVASK